MLHAFGSRQVFFFEGGWEKEYGSIRRMKSASDGV